MTMPENNTQPDESLNEQELPPIIPSWVFLLATAIGLIGAVAVFFLNGEMNIVGWAGLAVAVISLIVWAFMFPEEVLDIIRGRSLQFGGVGVIVTAVLIVAVVLVYGVIKDQALSQDFSERDVYSLDTEVRDVLQAFGDDPTIPTVQIIGFYNTASAGQRDRISVLLQDMVNNSGGKIAGYEFVDPAIQPQLTTEYLGENARVPAIVVATIDLETGDPSTTNFEVAAPDTTGILAAGQFQIINAVLSLSVEGDFRAYFLNVDGSLDTSDAGNGGASGFVGDIEDEWTVETIDPILLQNLPFTLNDPNASAEVMVIAGGTQPLSDEDVAVISQYVQDGGDLVVLGDINTDGGVSTANAENFANLMWENFGVRLRNDLVLDPAIPVRQLGQVFLVNNYGTHPVVQGLIPADNQLVLTQPHSIEISDTPPAGVTVTVLVSTTEDGYAKADVPFDRDLTEEQLAFTEGDLQGEIPVGVAVENTNTGARLVLFGSADLMDNEWREFRNIEGPEVSESSIFWASDARDISAEVRQLRPEPPELDQPIFITQDQLRFMGFISIGLLPFGLLAFGLVVWWLRRPSLTNN